MWPLAIGVLFFTMFASTRRTATTQQKLASKINPVATAGKTWVRLQGDSATLFPNHLYAVVINDLAPKDASNADLLSRLNAMQVWNTLPWTSLETYTKAADLPVGFPASNAQAAQRKWQVGLFGGKGTVHMVLPPQIIELQEMAL